MKRFVMFRKADLSKTHDKNQANPPDEPQFEGVIFSDGVCVVRWLTGKRSTAIWNSFEDMMAIHGHPEYESELIWLEDVIKEKVIEEFECFLSSFYNQIQIQYNKDIPKEKLMEDINIQNIERIINEMIL